MARRESVAGREPDAGRALPGWSRSAILWLGVALLAASLAGVVLTVALALRHADTPLAVEGERLLSVPTDSAGPGARR